MRYLIQVDNYFGYVGRTAYHTGKEELRGWWTEDRKEAREYLNSAEASERLHELFSAGLNRTCRVYVIAVVGGARAGKTTQMLKDAVERAKSGERVLVLVGSAREVIRIERLLTQAGSGYPHLSRMVVKSVDHAEDLLGCEAFNWIYVDHAAWEEHPGHTSHALSVLGPRVVKYVPKFKVVKRKGVVTGWNFIRDMNNKDQGTADILYDDGRRATMSLGLEEIETVVAACEAGINILVTVDITMQVDTATAKERLAKLEAEAAKLRALI
jgi:hypothetical protein